MTPQFPIFLIVAASRNGVIGRDGGLPWRLPAETRHFVRTTMGHPVIMGRKTWESIGKPLKGRTNIVVTRTDGYEAPGCVVARSLPDAVARARDTGAAHAFVAGGEGLYREALPMADRVYLSRIDVELDGDAHFPALDPDEWVEVDHTAHPADDDNRYAFAMCVLERRGRQ